MRRVLGEVIVPKRGVIQSLRALFFFFGIISVLVGMFSLSLSKSAFHEGVALLFLIGGGLMFVGATILLSLERIDRLLEKQLEVAMTSLERRDITSLDAARSR